MKEMFSSLAKRSSYKVIEEDHGSPTQISTSTFVGENRRKQNEPEEEDEEDDQQHDGPRSMYESAPPLHHGIAVSIKSGGEKDTELQRSRNDQSQWDHIKDVDQFFAYIYEYYQHKGFTCIALRYVFSLLRFAFVVLFSTFLVQCVDYDVLFYNRNTTMDGVPLPPKRRIQDSFIAQCPSQLNKFVVLALFFATCFWLVHFIRICYRLVQFYEIKQFFGSQLQVSDAEMQNLPWSQIVQKLCLVQQRLHLIVNKESISSLDVYQRILRHKNYFVALVYYDILPPHINLPLLGPVRYLSTGLRFNLEWLMFWGPWSPWKGAYELKDEYKDSTRLPAISRTMQRTVAIMALANFVCSPLVFIYQLLFSFFSYSEHFQRDPNVFGMRKYSNYGREKLRHFNEMDHELDARLNRSYEFAARYTDQFISPLAKIVARNTAFIAAAFFVVLCALTAYDEDTLKIEHVTTMMTLTGGVVLLCRVFIPNENLVLCQQFLMRQITANIHYAPKSWLRNAHSTEIHREFTQIFRLKMEILVEELLSPLLTPIILYFRIWHRVPELVTFLHEHTIHLDGLGDICSLAQMDITRDGDIRLASLNQSIIVQEGGQGGAGQKSMRNRRDRRSTACGKVELSLLNFAIQNPDWEPPKASAEFIRNVKELISLEVSNAATTPNDENQLSHPPPSNQQQQQAQSVDAQTLAFMQAAGCSQMSLHELVDQQQQALVFGTESVYRKLGQQKRNNSGLSNSKTAFSSLATTSRQGPPPYQCDVPLQTFSTSTTNQLTDSTCDGRRPQPPNNDNANSSFVSSTAAALPTPLDRSISASNSNFQQHPPQHGPYTSQQQHGNNMFMENASNSRLFASSFITPSPLAAIVQPRAVQESNLRATEMSLHALAVNHMLFLNNSSMEQQQRPMMGHRLNSNNGRGTTTNAGGYGSFFQSFRRGGSRYGAPLVMDSLAESNIWGVPAESSQVVHIRGAHHEPGGLEEEEDDDGQTAKPPLPLSEERGRLLR